MGLTKEEQRQKIREQGEQTKPIPTKGIARLIKNKLTYLSAKKNRKLNKRLHKPPKIFYGFNTNK